MGKKQTKYVPEGVDIEEGLRCAIVDCLVYISDSIKNLADFEKR